MASNWKPITRLSILCSLIASALIWLPYINALASAVPEPAAANLLATTILAELGIVGLIWLNWLLRRHK